MHASVARSRRSAPEFLLCGLTLPTQTTKQLCRNIYLTTACLQHEANPLVHPAGQNLAPSHHHRNRNRQPGLKTKEQRGNRTNLPSPLKLPVELEGEVELQPLHAPERLAAPVAPLEHLAKPLHDRLQPVARQATELRIRGPAGATAARCGRERQGGARDGATSPTRGDKRRQKREKLPHKIEKNHNTK